jgi:hypothetical protein
VGERRPCGSARPQGMSSRRTRAWSWYFRRASPASSCRRSPELLPHSPVFFACDDIQQRYQELTGRGVRFPTARLVVAVPGRGRHPLRPRAAALTRRASPGPAAAPAWCRGRPGTRQGGDCLRLAGHPTAEPSTTAPMSGRDGCRSVRIACRGRRSLPRRSLACCRVSVRSVHCPTRLGHRYPPAAFAWPDVHRSADGTTCAVGCRRTGMAAVGSTA